MSTKRKPNWDEALVKAPNAGAKLKNLPRSVQETMWELLVPTDPEATGSTPEDVMVWLQDEHDISCARSTFTEWRSWYAWRLRMEEASARSEQAKLDWLRENPDASPADLEALGQFMFTSEAIDQKDVKAFTALMRERSRRMALEQDNRKLVLLEAAAAEAKRKLQELAEKGKSKGGISAETIQEIEEAAGLL